MRNFARIRIDYTGGRPRREMYDGRTHLVVPVSIMVEGVHHGSGGPILHTANELARATPLWNGTAIVLMHPSDSAGREITANSPALWDERGLGRVFNAHWRDGIRAEAWFDEARTRRVAPTIVTRLEAGETMEVSAGWLNDLIQESGDWNGESYRGRAINEVPDHLAVLIDDNGRDIQGACSRGDGCGLNVNNGGKRSMDPKKLLVAIGRTARNLGASLSLTKDGQFDIKPAVQTNELSHEDVRSALQHAIDHLDGNGWIHVVADVYENEFVYAAHTTNPNETYACRYYRRSYSVAEDGAVNLGNDTQEVREVREYVPVANAAPDKAGKAEEARAVDKKQMVDAIIASDGNKFTEPNREYLMSQDVKILEILGGCACKDAKAVNTNDANANANAAPATATTTPAPGATNTTVVNNAAPEPPRAPESLQQLVEKDQSPFGQFLRRSVAFYEGQRRALVQRLITNERVKAAGYNEQALNAMGPEELERLAGLAEVPGANNNVLFFADYTAAAGATSAREAQGNAGVPDMPKLEIPAYQRK